MAQKFFGKSANLVNLKMHDMSIFSDEALAREHKVFSGSKTIKNSKLT